MTAIQHDESSPQEAVNEISLTFFGARVGASGMTASGPTMPNFGLSDADSEAIVQYLTALDQP